jgi:surface polysaccharide O-acyltransferase-like enzyme
MRFYIKNENINGRESGVELLKIIAIFMIIISHVVQYVNTSNQSIITDIYTPTANVQLFLVKSLNYMSMFGNQIFIIASSWFLQDSNKTNKKKMLQMIMDIWFISVICLMFMCIVEKFGIDAKLVLKSLFPTTFSNNWFMTCYLLFYSVHHILNKIMDGMKQEGLLKSTLMLVFLYLIVNTFVEAFFTTELMVWLTVYFIIGYMKRYLVNIAENIRFNIAIACIGIIGTFLLVVVTNLIGLGVQLPYKGILYWCDISNPLIIIGSIGIFNVFRKMTFKSRVINYVSARTMTIYLIHENLLLKSYYRPRLWQWVYSNFGYGYVIIWVFILALLIFVFSLVISVVYQETVEKVVVSLRDRLYIILKREYGLMEKILINCSK